MTWQFKLTGIEGIQRNLQAVQADAERAIAGELFRFGHDVRSEALPITPIDTGFLRNSCYVTPPQRGEIVSTTVDASESQVAAVISVATHPREGWTSIEVGYAAPYAVYVHERTDLQHRPPTQAKFLEEAMNRLARTLENRLARAVQRALAAGSAS